MKTCKDCLHEKICVIKAYPDAFENTQWDNEPCDHFKDKSLILNLPCKVGDTVYIVGEIRGVYEARVRVFFFNEKGVEMIRTTECDIPFSNWQKTVFTSYKAAKEAEQALKEREQG